jgi:hypothetical protein
MFDYVVVHTPRFHFLPEPLLSLNHVDFFPNLD